MTNDCKTCPVSTGTHKPAEAVHQIDEPQADALRLAAICESKSIFPVADELRRQHARIAELEAELEAVGAGGVQRLAIAPQPCSRSHPHEEMTPMCELRTEIARLTNALARAEAAAPPAVQAAVPEAIEQMAVDRYKVVPSHESMFHRWAVVAGNGTQQLYIGREGECQNMARKFMGAFLDGAFVAMQNAAPAHPAEGVHAAVIAGAIFDFAGYLTTLPHEKALHCSEAHEASPMVEAITEWCKRRGLRTDGARVETWRAALAAQAKQGGA